MATVKQVAEYFGVGIEAIQSLIKDNREELNANGYKVYKKSEILNVLKGQLENVSVPNRGMGLFTSYRRYRLPPVFAFGKQFYITWEFIP